MMLGYVNLGYIQKNILDRSRGSESEVGVDGEQVVSIGVNSVHCNVVDGLGCDGGNVEGKGVGPSSGGDIFNLREVFVVDERTEEVALEVDVIEGGISDPEAAKGEEDGLASLGWVGAGVGLGVVEDEPVLAVDLGESHAVGDSL